MSLACDGVRHVRSNIAYSLLQSENHQIGESGSCLTFPFRAGALNRQHKSPKSTFLGHRTSRAHGGGCCSGVGSDQSPHLLVSFEQESTLALFRSYDLEALSLQHSLEHAVT